MATQRFLNEFRQERAQDYTNSERRLLRRIASETIQQPEPAEEMRQFINEFNYEEFQRSGSFAGPGYKPAESYAGRLAQQTLNRALLDRFNEEREEIRQRLILQSQEIFRDNPTAMNYGVRFFQGATPDELNQLLNTRLDMYELDITRPPGAPAGAPPGVVGTDPVSRERIRELLNSAPRAQQLMILDGIQTAARSVAGNLAASQGLPRQVGEIPLDITANYMRANSGPIMATLGAIAAKIKSGYRDVSGLSILLGGLGIAGAGVAARHYLNEAEEFIQEIEEAKRDGVKFGPREELAIEKLQRHLIDVNRLGNAAAEGGQLVNIDSTIVKNMIALENSKTNNERDQHIESLTKLTYVKNYQLAMYERQLRNNSKISGAPPRLRPGKYGLRPIRITPDWRGAII